MIHQKDGQKLNRDAPHREALLKNMSDQIVEHERIETTQTKAKKLQPYIEQLITKAEDDTVHNRRQVRKKVNRDQTVEKLFSQVAPRFYDRPGGYTRILKLDERKGDDARRAIIEFVE